MLTEAVGKEENEELLSVADQLIERGRQQGLREGLRGQRNMLLKLLGLRFGALSDATVARVNAAEGAELELWAERVLTAPTSPTCSVPDEVAGARRGQPVGNAAREGDRRIRSGGVTSRNGWWVDRDSNPGPTG